MQRNGVCVWRDVLLPFAAAPPRARARLVTRDGDPDGDGAVDFCCGNGAGRRHFYAALYI